MADHPWILPAKVTRDPIDGEVLLGSSSSIDDGFHAVVSMQDGIKSGPKSRRFWLSIISNFGC